MKFKEGDRIRIVNYFHLIWQSKKNAEQEGMMNVPAVGQDKDFYYYDIDHRRVGEYGTVVECTTTQGKPQYSIYFDVGGTSSWFSENQMEAINQKYDEEVFEIWMEGYEATGESGPAQLIGRYHGITFEEACKNFTEPANIIRQSDYKIIAKKGEKLKLDENRDYPAIWACRLYDNEIDARKSFG